MARRSLFAAAAVFLAAACTDAPVAPAPDAPGLLTARTVASAAEQVMPGEIIVRMRVGADARTVAAAHGLAVSAEGRGKKFVVLRGAVGSERALAARLRQDERVAVAEPNYLRQPTATDPRLWAFHNPGGLSMSYTKGKYKGQPMPADRASLPDADADIIEGIGVVGTDVVLGSLDTGVDFAHPELAGRLIAGADWYTGDGNPTDEDGHGTHTTGTMAGATVGVAGVTGAAPHVRVFVQRVCGRRGCPTSAIVNAIYAAADHGVVAMNISIGGPSESQAEMDAIAYATEKGVLVIASAGNDRWGAISCPACDPNAISVAATSWRDVPAYYSNWGSGLDIAAPGGECYTDTTDEGCIYSAFLGGGYAWMLGTSMAAPLVTGTAGVVASVTGLRGAALRERILGTTDDLGPAGTDTRFGTGRLNTFRAVTGVSLEVAP